jgi:hypothetical protein
MNVDGHDGKRAFKIDNRYAEDASAVPNNKRFSLESVVFGREHIKEK